MSYLLDTCVVSEPVRPGPDSRVIAWLRAADEHALFLSVLTVGEIRKGIARSSDSRKRRTLARWLDDELVPRFGARLLPVDLAVSRRWGEITGDTEARGVSLPVIDALLAATALEHGLAVVTRNARDFERCGVRVLNPWGHA